MRNGRMMASVLVLAATMGLAACDTAEERAEGHYQRGLAFLAEGEVDRGMLELRNVFRLDVNHRGARLAYAEQLVEMGNVAEAIGHFRRLVEQDWSSVAGHKHLAELGLQIQDPEAAATHADRAYELDPADPEIRGLKAAVDYHRGERPAAVEMALGVVAERPDNLPAQMVLIADAVNAGDHGGALARIDDALGQTPDDQGLHYTRLSVLERLGDRAALGLQLDRMSEIFPDDAGLINIRLRWHMQQGETDRAETVLREVVASRPAGSAERTEAELWVVQFLHDLHGPDAARAEIERLLAEAPDSHPHRRALAGLEASLGRTDEAIAVLEALIADSEPSDARRDSQVALAEILRRIGRTGEGDALVDAVLAEDETHIGGLKLRAVRLIDADRPDDAIRDLRAALGQEPRNVEVLTLMATAHERAGARELAGERLALAVEASNRGSAESIRYARFLLQDERVGAAEAVVVEALRARPEDRDLLMTLGQIHLARSDWTRAEQTARLLRRQDNPQAQAMAATLEANALRGQNRNEEALATIQRFAGEETGNARVVAGVVQGYLLAEDLDGARAYLEGVRAERPDDPSVRMIEASLLAIAGDRAAAEEGYRALIAAEPRWAAPYLDLYGLLLRDGREGEAAAVLEEGIAATGSDPRLMFVEAGRRERAGDFEGAIAIFEDLYARDTSAVVVANNLASLLATYRTDDADLERAFAIARRLRGTEVPHFQDTYGWILARRGDYEEALRYLEPAAAALPAEPVVQYHLGVTQARLGQTEAARERLERAIALAGEDSTLPQVEAARRLLDELSGPAGATPGTTPDTAPQQRSEVGN